MRLRQGCSTLSIGLCAAVVVGSSIRVFGQNRRNVHNNDVIRSGGHVVDLGQTERTPRLVPTDSERAEIEFKRRELAVRDALRGLAMETLTMPQAVALAGGKLSMNEAPNEDAFREADIRTLARQSRLIVVARPVAAPVAHLSEDGQHVVSRYLVKIDETIRSEKASELASDGQVSVDVPGGVLKFPEGVVEAASGVELKVGQRYVLFLQRLEDSLAPDGQVKLAERRAASGRPAADAPLIITGQYYEGLFLLDGGNVRSLVAPTFAAFKEKQDRRALHALVEDAKAAK